MKQTKMICDTCAHEFVVDGDGEGFIMLRLAGGRQLNFCDKICFVEYVVDELAREIEDARKPTDIICA